MVKFICFLVALTTFANSPLDSAFAAEKKVKVESLYRYEKTDEGKLKLRAASYRESRPAWGVRLNFAVGTEIETQNERAHPIGGALATLKSDGTPIQIDISMTKNYKYFSIGPEIGYFSSTILNRCGHDIDFKGFTMGAGLYLDGLFESAYLVPFASVGMILPDITVKTTTVGTCTLIGMEQELEAEDFALYYRGGFLIGLNWLDKKLATRALSDYGLQNSFLYFAVRQIPSTSDVDGADIGTNMYFEYGLQLEF